MSGLQAPLYDPLVRAEIEKHYEEKILDVLFSEWFLHHYVQESSAEPPEAAATLERGGDV